MEYPDNNESIRILKTYGKVEFKNNLGTRTCILSAYPKMADYFKYYHVTVGYMTDSSPVQSSYYDLYHAIRRETEDIENGH